MSRSDYMSLLSLNSAHCMLAAASLWGINWEILTVAEVGTSLSATFFWQWFPPCMHGKFHLTPTSVAMDTMEC